MVIVVISYDGNEELDPLFNQAIEFVTKEQRVSMSSVQRQFRIGYNMLWDY